MFYIRCQVKRFNKLAAVVFLVLPTTANASQKYIESTANCAAQMFIMTAVGSTITGLDQYFAQQVNLSKLMLGLYMEESSSKTITNGMVMRAMEKKLAAIRSNAMTTMTVASVSNCIGWNFSLAKVLRKYKKAPQGQIESKLLEGPKPTQQYEYPYPDADQLPEWVSIAKKNWRERGFITPGKVRRELTN